jgi:arginase family enzyme
LRHASVPYRRSWRTNRGAATVAVHPTLADVDVLSLLGVVDCGNVTLTPGRIEDAMPRIEAAVGMVLDAGAVPVGIGGDGSVDLGFRVITAEDLLRRGFAQTMTEFRDLVAGRPVYTPTL